MEGGREIVSCFGETLALGDDCVDCFEEGLQLGFKGVKVDFSLMEPLQ